MSTFAALGATASRKFITNSTSVSVGGMESNLTQGETTEITLTLPRPVAVRASFKREGIGAKIAKLFKKEIQTGDTSFDDIVYIATDTPEATAALLQRIDVRATILDAVAVGGSIEIDGAKVTAVVGGHDHGDAPGLVRLLAVLLG